MWYCMDCGGRDISGDAIYYPNAREQGDPGNEFAECGDDYYCGDCGECSITDDRREAAKARLERYRETLLCPKCKGVGRVPLVVGPGVPGAGSFARFEPCDCASATA